MPLIALVCFPILTLTLPSFPPSNPFADKDGDGPSAADFAVLDVTERATVEIVRI